MPVFTGINSFRLKLSAFNLHDKIKPIFQILLDFLINFYILAKESSI